MSKIDNIIQKPISGINKDVAPVNQPEGSYRFALNCVNESSIGDKNTLITEEANEKYKSLNINIIPEGYPPDEYVFHIIGSIYISNNDNVIFGVTKPENNDTIVRSFIGTFNVKDGIKIFIYDKDNSCLNFNIEHQITGEYRLRNGCEQTIYWVDGVNKVKTLNFSENYNSEARDQWQEEYDLWLKDGITLPPYVENDLSEKCLQFALVKSSKTFPIFKSITVENQGQLKAGTYNFAIKYVDENGNDTNWLLVSQMIPIYNDNTTNNYDDINGNENKIEGVDTVNNLAFGKNVSNKSIKLVLENLNTEYTYYRIAIMEATSGLGTITRVLESHNQSTRDDVFIHDGNDNKYVETTIEEILPGQMDFGLVKHIAQLEDRLLFGNVANVNKQYNDLQRMASKIRSRFVIQQVETDDVNLEGDPKNPNTYFQKMSYMGGEVYAFGIIYIFKDGVESPVYHIPGRFSDGTDRDPIDSNDDNRNHFDPTDNVQKWQVYDTANVATRKMAFWEMKDNVYQDKPGCDNYWGSDMQGNSLVGTKIKHHKFPDRNTIQHHVNEAAIVSDKTKSTVNISVNKKSPNKVTEITAPTLIIACYVETAPGVQGWVYPTFSIPNDFNDSNTSPTYNGTVDIEGKVLNVVVHETYESGATSNPFWIHMFDWVANGYYEGANSDQNLSVTINYTTRTIGSNSEYGAVNLLGIEFDGIQLPIGVQGYKIVRGKRDQFNRTVLAKGFAGHTRRNNEYLGFTSFTQGEKHSDESDDLQSEVVIDGLNKYIITPEHFINNKEINATYLKYESSYKKETRGNTYKTDVHQDVNDEDGGWFDSDGFDWVGGYRIGKFIPESNTMKNITVEETNYLSPAASKNNYDTGLNDDTRRLYNVSMDNNIGIIRGDRQFTGIDNTINKAKDYMYYVSLKIDIDIHPILDNIEYIQCKNNIQTETSDINFGGDTFISHFHLTTSTYQKYVTASRVLEFIAKVVMIVAAAILSVIATIGTFGIAGPIVVAAWIAVGLSAGAQIAVAAIETLVDDYENTSLDVLAYDSSIWHLWNDVDDTYYNSLEHAHGMFVESDINVSLRQDANNMNAMLVSHTPSSVKIYATDKFLAYDKTSEAYKYYMITKPEIYWVNKDYSRINTAKVWFPLSSAYDCKSNCAESFPNRIYYSEKSFLEEKFDSFGNVKSLNYTVIPGEHGEITNIFVIKDALFAHTQSNLWMIPANIQERITGDIVSLIGTGGFFGAEARKLSDSSIGSAGCIQKFATLKTDMGVFFIDDNEGVLYLLQYSKQGGTKINRLSDSGMSKWFKNNSQPLLAKQIFEKENTTIKIHPNPANPSGSGYCSTYDNYNNRFILTKKELILTELGLDALMVVDESNIELTDPLGGGGCIPNDAHLIFNKADGIFYYGAYGIGGGGPMMYFKIYCNLEDTDFFNVEGWTISFANGFVSFHSYVPGFYINDNKNFYSIKDEGIWKHNIKNKYLTFYEQQYPQIIDLVALKSPLGIKYYDNIILQTQAIKDNTEQRYITFNKIIIYNSRQSTGEQLLAVDKKEDADMMLQAITNVSGELKLKKLEKDWRINGFRDMVIDYTNPLFINTIIDKEINDVVIDKDKNWEQLEKFKDKYLQISLIFDNKTDVKLITDYIIESEQTLNE